MAFAIRTLQNVSHLIFLCHFFNSSMQNPASIVLGKLISSVRRVIVSDRAIKFNTSSIWFMGTTRRQILFTSFLRCTTSNAQRSVWVKVEVLCVWVCLCVASAEFQLPAQNFLKGGDIFGKFMYLSGAAAKKEREKNLRQRKSERAKQQQSFYPQHCFLHMCVCVCEGKGGEGESECCATRCYCCCLCAYDLLHGNACAVLAHGLLLPLLLRGILLQQNANLSISSKVRQAFFPAVVVAVAIAVARLSLDVVCCWHLPAKTTAGTCFPPCPALVWLFVCVGAGKSCNQRQITRFYYGQIVSALTKNYAQNAINYAVAFFFASLALPCFVYFRFTPPPSRTAAAL